ncbi:acylamino-acid-releasing enzyme-like [Limulus polyphemus]|uniref:Acylamino-acid-releasing enzyme n=1 Tax=Limulus polyphemus TaxID=6850 RepID=A0ABM1B049_LIMPO|nr:acylamino-acid-releasing enzyme-like [Limulus polyphemus]
MDLQVEEIIHQYREFSKVPNPIKANLILGPKENSVSIRSEWSVRDLERSERVQFVVHHVGHSNGKDQFQVLTVGPATLMPNLKLSSVSSSGKFLAILSETPNKKGEKQQYLEVWTSKLKILNVNLQNLEAHGSVCDDKEFGCLEWSNDESYLLYIAEKKKPKGESFFKESSIHSGSLKKEEIRKGVEFLYEDNWGEQLEERHHTVVCVINISTGSVTVVDHLPPGVSSAQAVWSPNDAGVVCVGWDEKPYCLGLVYCKNRRSHLYYQEIETNSCVVISNKEKCVFSPRFSPDNHYLVFLESQVGGPHFSGSRLIKYDWRSKESTVVVDLVNDSLGGGFPGIYLNGLPSRCWTKDSNCLVFNTFWKSKQELVCVDIHNGQVERLTNDEEIGSWELLDMRKDIIIASRSSLNVYPHLILGRLQRSDQKTDIEWIELDNTSHQIPDIDWTIIPLKPTKETENSEFLGIEYEAVLVKPKKGGDEKIHSHPLIVWPHGGPHSLITPGYALYPIVFAKLGFASLLVNFRGSLGFGEHSINSLLGNIGNQDVKDVQLAVENVLTREDINRAQLFLFGGSHGGFLVTHIAGQFPDQYRACACRNPVVNIPALQGNSDIPDWCFTEAGLGKQFSFQEPATSEVLTTMWNCSPIRYVNNIKIPVLFLIGKNDLRVPSNQGLYMFKLLKARGRPVKCHVYEDNHPLSKVEVEADAFVNTVLWFAEHLASEDGKL